MSEFRILRKSVFSEVLKNFISTPNACSAEAKSLLATAQFKPDLRQGQIHSSQAPLLGAGSSRSRKGSPARAQLRVFARLHRELNRPGAGPRRPQAKAVRPGSQELYLQEVAERAGSRRLPPLWIAWRGESRTLAAARGRGWVCSAPFP